MRRINVASALIYQITGVVLFFFLLMSCDLVGWSGMVGHAQAQGAASVGGCPLYPADNIWNAPVDNLPVHPHSADYISNIASSGRLRYDITIPITIVPVTGFWGGGGS